MAIITCPKCGGIGIIKSYNTITNTYSPTTVEINTPCTFCGGSGLICVGDVEIICPKCSAKIKMIVYIDNNG